MTNKPGTNVRISGKQLIRGVGGLVLSHSFVIGHSSLGIPGRVVWGLVLGHSLVIGHWSLGIAQEPVRLTTDGDFKQHLAWSSDGKKFLFTRIHKGKMAVWTMNADGSECKPLLNYNGPHFDGAWSPDGKRIAFVYDVLQGTDGKLQINTANADGTGNQVLIPNQAFEESPRWSPDGKYIAFVSTRAGNQEIFRADADGKNVKRLSQSTGANYNPCWSPDSKELVFTSSRFRNLEICA